MAKVEIRKYKKVKNYYFFCAIIPTLLPTFQKPVLVAENFQVFRQQVVCVHSTYFSESKNKLLLLPGFCQSKPPPLPHEEGVFGSLNLCKARQSGGHFAKLKEQRQHDGRELLFIFTFCYDIILLFDLIFKNDFLFFLAATCQINFSKGKLLI